MVAVDGAADDDGKRDDNRGAERAGSIGAVGSKLKSDAKLVGRASSVGATRRTLESVGHTGNSLAVGSEHESDAERVGRPNPEGDNEHGGDIDESEDDVRDGERDGRVEREQGTRAMSSALATTSPTSASAARTSPASSAPGHPHHRARQRRERVRR
ncbi:hypothetical protein HDZ31DRAFT_67656 [Schizophyllum fasciatum]